MFDTLRTTLLITLAILVVAVAIRRYKQYIREQHTPVPRHAELLNVEVVYHPLRVHVLVRLPREEEVFPAVLGGRPFPINELARHALGRRFARTGISPHRGCRWRSSL